MTLNALKIRSLLVIIQELSVDNSAEQQEYSIMKNRAGKKTVRLFPS